MEWYEFTEKMYDWSDSTIKNKIYQLEDIEPEELEFAMSHIGVDLSDQLIRKAIRLRTPISEEILADIEGYISFDATNELRDYMGLELQLTPLESFVKSIDEVNVDALDKQVRIVAKEVERLTGIKAEFPEESEALATPRQKEVSNKPAYEKAETVSIEEEIVTFSILDTMSWFKLTCVLFVVLVVLAALSSATGSEFINNLGLTATAFAFLSLIVLCISAICRVFKAMTTPPTQEQVARYEQTQAEKRQQKVEEARVEALRDDTSSSGNTGNSIASLILGIIFFPITLLLLVIGNISKRYK